MSEAVTLQRGHRPLIIYFPCVECLSGWTPERVCCDF
uniref:Uncharacterized protein n=1 Tax=Anguilla anguilla TaxID=7936 RepID=A0A0E9RBZ3_ANGAN